MNSLVVRQVRPGETEVVRAQLVSVWHATYDAIYGPEKVTAITDRWHAIDVLRRQIEDPGAAFLAAVAGDRIVGQIFARKELGEVLALYRLYVEPGVQRQGVGARLLEAAVAQSAPLSRILLTVEKANPSGVAFYRKQGFIQIAEAPEDGMTLLTMEKRLCVS